MMKDDIGTSAPVFIGLNEADAESATIGNKNLPILAPVAGKLLKIFVRSGENMSASGHDTNLTWRLYTRSLGVAVTGNASIIGTKVVAGNTTQTMHEVDFTDLTTTGASGTNVIAAGDKVQISVQSDASSDEQLWFITCLWEWNLS